MITIAQIDAAGRLCVYQGEACTVVRDEDHLFELIAEHGELCLSSTIEFPEEFTPDPAVIRMCRKLAAGP
jgi:hypothetical protein